MQDGYIPKEQRKNILFLSDDFRMPSGIGVMSKEIILGTAHRYNWIQVGAAVVHPEAGKVVDASEAVAKEIGVPDAYVRIYPQNGYGDANLIRTLMVQEKIDGILHFTDPRYWIWLYQIEHELREHIPLMFYHVWDDLPFPRYNESYYRSCDYIACISKQTYNIVRQVWQKDKPEQWQVEYIPHGIDSKVFTPLADLSSDRIQEMRRRLDIQEGDFIVLYNNRNIRRKMTGDVVLAFREFFLTLTEEQQRRAKLVLHTAPVDDNGTDLIALIKECAPEINATFSIDRLAPDQLNELYNLSDVVINLASNEGFGLGTAEALMAGKMIIVNVTGGLQDQCGFDDGEGNYLDPDVHFNDKWGSNHDGKYRSHGEFAVPVFPNNRALIGSPPTPYIFDDRCSWEDAAKALRKVYDLGVDERARRGMLGRQYMLSEGFSAKSMCDRFIHGIDTTLKNFKPRKRFVLEKA